MSSSRSHRTSSRSPAGSGVKKKAKNQASVSPQRSAPPEPNLPRALRLAMELMRIPGPSGEEAEVSAAIIAHLREAGLDEQRIKQDSAHRQTRIAGQVGNLVVSLPGTVRGPRRMLSAHLDTVPICVGSRPKREGNLVVAASAKTGLGADNRAGCAVLLSTLLQILEQQLPHPPLTFCWFVQEEVGLQGVRSSNQKLWSKPQFAFNWDGGSASKLTLGATGAYRMRITVTGRASHAGVAPERGVSAIAIAGLAIADLQQRGWHGLVQKDGIRGTSNIGVIEGGLATNVITDHVTLRAEARSHDPAFRQRILAEIENAFRRAASEVRNVDGQPGEVQIESTLDYESFLLSAEEPCVRIAAAAIRAIGKEPEQVVSSGGLDANWMTAFGVPTVSLGCGQLNQHMTTEALDIEQFFSACRIALQIASPWHPAEEQPATA